MASFLNRHRRKSTQKESVTGPGGGPASATNSEPFLNLGNDPKANSSGISSTLLSPAGSQSSLRTPASGSMSLPGTSSRPSPVTPEPAKSASAHILMRLRYVEGHGDDVTATVAVDRAAALSAVLDVAYNKFRMLCDLQDPKEDYAVIVESGSEEITGLEPLVKHPLFSSSILSGTIPNLSFVHRSRLSELKRTGPTAAEVAASVAGKRASIQLKRNPLSLSLPVFLNNTADSNNNAPGIKKPARNRSSTVTSTTSSHHSGIASPNASPPHHGERQGSVASSTRYTPLTVDIPDTGGFDSDVLSSVSSLSQRHGHPGASSLSTSSSLSVLREMPDSDPPTPSVKSDNKLVLVTKLEPTAEPSLSTGSRHNSLLRQSIRITQDSNIRRITMSSGSGFICKVQLTAECCSHVMCTPGTTIDGFKEKAVAKLKRLTGTAPEVSRVEIVTDDGASLPAGDTMLEDAPYYTQSKASGTEPAFKLLVLGSDSRRSSDGSKKSGSRSQDSLQSTNTSNANMEHDSIFSVIESYRSDGGGAGVSTSGHSLIALKPAVAASSPSLQSSSPLGLSRKSTIMSIRSARRGSKSATSGSSSSPSGSSQQIVVTPPPPSSTATGQVQKSNIPRYVRLDLPKGIYSNVAVTPDTTVAILLEKAAQKLQRVLGVAVLSENLELYLDAKGSGPTQHAPPMDSLSLSSLEPSKGLVSAPPVLPIPATLPIPPITLLSDLHTNSVFNPSTPVTFRVQCLSNVLDSIPDTATISPSEALPPFFTIRRTTHTSTMSDTPGMQTIRAISVRVVLPRGVITNVRITSASTAQYLLQRGLDKLKSMLGEQCEPAGFNVYVERPSTGMESQPLCLESPLSDVVEIDDVIRGFKSEVGDAAWFVVRSNADEQPPPSPTPSLASPSISAGPPSPTLGGAPHTLLTPGYSPAAASRPDDRRASLSNALLNRRPRLISPDDVFRDMQMFDGPSTERRSSFLPSSQLAIPTPVVPPSGLATSKPNNGSGTFPQYPSSPTSVRRVKISDDANDSLARRRQRPAALGLTENCGSKLSTVILHFDKSTSVSGSYSPEESITAIKASLWTLAGSTVAASYPPESCLLYYRQQGSRSLVQITDEDCTLRQLALFRDASSGQHGIVFRAIRQPSINRGVSSAGVAHAIAVLMAAKSAGAGTSGLSPSSAASSPVAQSQEKQRSLVRKRLANVRQKAQTCLAFDRIEPTQLPAHLRAILDKRNDRITIRLHFPHASVVRTLSCDVTHKVSELVFRIVEKYSLGQWWLSAENATADQFREELMAHLQNSGAGSSSAVGATSSTSASSSPASALSAPDSASLGQNPASAAIAGSMGVAAVDAAKQEQLSPEIMQAAAKQFVLQFQGRPHYLHPDHRLIDHYSIRYHIGREQKVSLIITIAPPDIAKQIKGDTLDRHPPRLEDMNEDDLARQVAAGDVLVEESKAAPGNHAELTLRGRDRTSIKMMSLWDLSMNLRVEITRAEGLTGLSGYDSLFVEAALAFGGKTLCATVRTHHVKPSEDPFWLNCIIFDIPVYNLPRNTRLCVTIFGVPVSGKRRASELDRANAHVPLASVCLLVIDDRGFLRQGMHASRLWEGQEASLIGPCTAPQRPPGPSMHIRFEEYTHPVVFPDLVEDAALEEIDYAELIASCKEEVGADIALITDVLQWDPLVPLDEDVRRVLWTHRVFLSSMPDSLPKVLLSASWDQLEDVIEIRRLLKIWQPVSIETALLLLDGYFADDDVREFAVQTLETLTDDSLGDFLMQLVQALSFEHRPDSALARFLLSRALRSRKLGHFFFWTIKAEMDKAPMVQLFSILLEIYLQGINSDIDDMLEQQRLVDKLNDAAIAVKQARVPDRKEILASLLKNVPITPGQRVPLNPGLHVSEIRVSKCKIMDSKKLPLWIVFRGAPSPNQRPMDLLNSSSGALKSMAVSNTSPTQSSPSLSPATNDAKSPIIVPVPTPLPDFLVIFKTGDDLRQDALTLQMMRIMDRLWRQDGLDLRMTLYGCMSTGRDQGFIEVVTNSATVSSIQVAYGGSTAAFKEEPLEKWIRQHNPDEADYDRAVNNFTLSCAGYCVATFCLGIGDRHNDNIMCHERGRLFHIDFGHFLGNMKRKFGIKRERAPFVLTPDFVHVISKKNPANFDSFVSTAVRAYLILRRNANIFMNLFLLMLSTGIPELQTADDLAYLRDAFCLGMTEAEAAEEFQGLIFESIRLGFSTQLNWWVHNLVHK